MRIESLPVGWTARAARMDDIDRVLELFDARARTPYGESARSRQSVESWWTSPRFSLATDTRLVLDADDTVAGMASVMNPGEPYSEFVPSAVVHPLYEDRSELWDRLHSWGLERAQELVTLASDGRRVIAACRASSRDSARRAALERAGFEVVRVTNRMRADLAAPLSPAVWPKGVSVRTADVGADLEAIAFLYLETWRDQRGFVEIPFDTVVAGFREDIEHEGARFDPTLWFLAVERDGLAGIALCSGYIAGDATRGYVNALGVSTSHRKHGIGLALLQHAFAEFHRRGYAAVELDVDTGNATGALGVYERAGMQSIRQSMAYEKELRPETILAS